MAIGPAQRGTGLGRRLMAFAEALARERGFRTIDMHARVSAQGFYERLGYRAFGEPFIETTVPHVAMRKHLGEPGGQKG